AAPAVTSLDVSADGAGRIVFSAYRGGRSDIYIMDDDGTRLERLTREGQQNSDPALSPDGSRVVFSSKRENNTDIYIMNVDGSHPVRLTDDLEVDAQPAFSPDGRTILFTSWRGARGAQLYTMNLDGSKLRAVEIQGSPSAQY